MLRQVQGLRLANVTDFSAPFNPPRRIDPGPRKWVQLFGK